MITLPPGFDAAALLSDLFTLAGPFVSLAFFIGCGFLLVRIFTSPF